MIPFTDIILSPTSKFLLFGCLLIDPIIGKLLGYTTLRPIFWTISPSLFSIDGEYVRLWVNSVLFSLLKNKSVYYSLLNNEEK